MDDGWRADQTTRTPCAATSTDIIDGREWRVTDGFGSLRQVGGSIFGNVVRGMSQLESVGGDLNAPVISMVSLRDIGGDIRGGGTFGLMQFPALETIGRDIVTKAGDFDSLANLRTIGRDLEVSYSDEVNFVLPALESVGRDVKVTINDSIADVEVPSLRTIGRDLRFHSNRNRNQFSGATERARTAFESVEAHGIKLICQNEVGDPCPYDDFCWDLYDESYCCPIGMSNLDCLSSLW